MQKTNHCKSEEIKIYSENENFMVISDSFIFLNSINAWDFEHENFKGIF